MSEQQYDIFFRGEALNGFDLETVKTNVGRLFKASPEKVEQLFSGKVIPLRKDLDKASAAKFKQALENAGARIYIKLAENVTATPAAAQTPPQTTENQAQSATTSTTNPAPLQSNTIPASKLVILPPGSDVLRADERPQVKAVTVDISGIKLASVFDQQAPQKAPPPPAPDTSHLSAAPAGADLLGGVKKAPPPPAPPIDHLSMAAPGADLAEGVEHKPIPPAPDVSFLSAAAPGADLREGITRKPEPAAPDTQHISLT